jgi:hypothetical protein
VDVATEYAMLHFGGRKYRARAIRMGWDEGRQEDEEVKGEDCSVDDGEAEGVEQGDGVGSSESANGDTSSPSQQEASLKKEMTSPHVEASPDERSVACPEIASDNVDIADPFAAAVSTVAAVAAATSATVVVAADASSSASGGFGPVARHKPTSPWAILSKDRAARAAEPSADPETPAPGPPPTTWDVTVRPRVGVVEPCGVGAAAAGGGPLHGTLPDEGLSWARFPWGLPPLDRRDARSVGRWGEAFVFQYLVQKYPPEAGAAVEWVNESEETRAAYDLKVTFSSGQGRGKAHPRQHETIFIEVKTTSSEHQRVFDFSPQEWDFATRSVGSRLVNYHIYRVFGAGDPAKVNMRVVTDLPAAIASNKARLCIGV